MKKKTILLYEYGELCDEAKERVKQWYLGDSTRSMLLTEDFENIYLQYFFPRSELRVEWSLNSCQGDGVNIYGRLDLNDVLNCFQSRGDGESDEWAWLDASALFTPKELRRLRYYREKTGRDAVITQNPRYSYCLADSIDFSDDWIEDLDWLNIRAIDKELIEKFQDATISVIEDLCREMESYGYKFLYEIDDRELDEICSANEWYFTQGGVFETA